LPTDILQCSAIVLVVCQHLPLSPATRFFLLDLESVKDSKPHVLAAACKTLPAKESSAGKLLLTIEGVGGTPAVVLLHAPKPPREITLAGQLLKDFTHVASEKLLWVRFPNESKPRELEIRF